MDPNSQTYLMIPVSASGPIQPQSNSESLDNPSQRSGFPSFFPSFLPTWSSMRAGPSIPPFENPSSSSISEVSPEGPEPPTSDDEMSVVKPLARRVCAFPFPQGCQELSTELDLPDLNVEC
jgi:hypothetical protein